jgi:putative sporulation protein YtaF
MLILSVTADAFAAAASMGGSKIHIPVRSAAVIAFVGTAFLGVSAAFSELIALFLPEIVCTIASALILFALGFINIFKNILREKYEPGLKDDAPAVLFLDENKADSDHNQIISVKEAALLSAALSADSLFVGIVSPGLTQVLPLWGILLLTMITGLIFIITGNKLGLTAAKITKIDLSKICGGLLILLGVLNLFK